MESTANKSQISQTSQTIKGSLILLLTAIIWGVAFVFQSTGMDYVGPFTFCCLRQFLGCMALTPVIFERRKSAIEAGNGERFMQSMKNAVKPGIFCGICLIVASALQQVGLQYTTVGKAGFLTALYVLFVPILGLFIGKYPSIRIWFCVATAVVGLYLLCMTESFSLSFGDFIEILCGIAFAFHIRMVDKYATDADGVTFAVVQFMTAGILAAFPMLIMEHQTLTSANLQGAAIAILYAGLLSTGVAYTLQIVAQKMVPPVLASLIMSLESVVSVIAGWLILKQALSIREIIGCVIMFVAIIVAQLKVDNQDNG